MHRQGLGGPIGQGLGENLSMGDRHACAMKASSSMSATSSSLTPQEVWWSIRDGYVDNTLFSSGVSVDGVLGDVDVGGGGVVPFTPQELYWAVRDGYVGDLVQHWFRNGGLSV